MTKKLILIIAGIVLFFDLSWSQNTDNPCRKTTEGTDFWFAFMEARSIADDHYTEVTLSSAVLCHFEIRIGKSNTVFMSGTVFPNQPNQIKLDWKLVEAIGSEEIQGKAIHLTSDNPLNVYALNYCYNSSDVALIYPVPSLGKEYFAICYEPNIDEYPNKTYRNGRNSEFLIVATEDNTTVTIVPSKVTDKGKGAGVEYSLTIDKGETYQVQSMNHASLGQGDLTGSHIVSDKPVAFFSGSTATTVPAVANMRGWDHLYEQIPPVQALGKKFMAVPLKSRGEDRYRILAAYDNTSVKVGKDTYTLDKKGEFKEFALKYNDPRIVEGSKPILLVQYSCSNLVDSAFTSGNGDPFMVVVSPLNQNKQNATFVAYQTVNITTRYFVNVVAKDDAVSFITLDQSPVIFKSLAGSGYSYAQITISAGSHNLKSSKADKGFIAYVYGFGGYDSYGYGAGYNLDIQLDLGYKYLNNKPFNLCEGTVLRLDAASYFDKYIWNTGDITSIISVSKDGMYKVTASTFNGCVLSDSVYIKVNEPVIDLGKDTVVCGQANYTLDAGWGFDKYLWPDGSTGQTFQVDSTGYYRVTGISNAGCRANDTVRVIIFTPEFTQNYKVATDEHPDISFADQTEAAVSYLWDFGDGETSVEKDPTHHYEEPGIFNVILYAKTNYGCVDSISSQVKIIPFKLLTPNAFRPDSDIPENRIFQPIKEGIDPQNYLLQIYNRVGSTVFETKNPETGWDGKMPNGTEAGSGIYVWIVKFLDIQGFDHLQKGTVMVVR